MVEGVAATNRKVSNKSSNLNAQIRPNIAEQHTGSYLNPFVIFIMIWISLSPVLRCKTYLF